MSPSAGGVASHGRRASLIVAVLAAAFAVCVAGALALPRSAPRVSFERDVQPIFTRSCISCHPVSFQYLDLREGRAWQQLVRVPASGDPAYDRVLPGRPELSYLLTHSPDPSNAKLLAKRDRRLIAAWIREGAPRN